MKLKTCLLQFAKTLRKKEPFSSKEEKDLFYIKLGLAIRKIRTTCGFTQEEFCSIIGSKQNILSALEHGRYKGYVLPIVESIGRVFYKKDFINHGNDEAPFDLLFGTLNDRVPISSGNSQGR